MPSKSNSTTWSFKSDTTHLIGLANLMFLPPQRIFLGKLMSLISEGIISAKISDDFLPIEEIFAKT